MTRDWADVRAELEASGAIDTERVQALEAEMRAEVRAYRLAEIRRAHGIGQDALAKQLGISQSRVSRIERGDLDRSEIATVRGYIEALGGEIHIVARFGDESITVA
ncbi:helix-turn-helix domain-containing protein [Streptomonospora sp. S1-112]|uniref:Helix-turn-helix domain-containing protein n=1 Tax=Streptomonospora mangrovi TaxID=2883123 RepID=A0A9X3NVX9_9ACTN|nr:XRE family transcriptional regulator [Streptomonospora mangrovi]MDA0565251.1 helix-turn-helix domain-containing protein [Streptomonospora mangrovi]